MDIYIARLADSLKLLTLSFIVFVRMVFLKSFVITHHSLAYSIAIFIVTVSYVLTLRY